MTEQTWKAIYTTTLDYDANLVCERLRASGIPAAVMNKRDHAYNLTLGDLARIKVMVPADRVDEARALLAQNTFSDQELTAAALAANPFGEDIPELEPGDDGTDNDDEAKAGDE